MENGATLEVDVSLNHKNLYSLETLIDLLPSAAFAIESTSRKIAHINQAALDLLAEKKDVVIGKICHEYLCPAQVGSCPILDLKQSVDRSRKFLITSDRKSIPILKSVKIIYTGTEDYLIETFTALSEAVEAEAVLGFLRLTCDYLPDFIVCVDFNGRYSYVNEAVCQTLGYSRDEMVCKHVWDINRALNPTRWQELLKNVRGRGLTTYPARLSRRDGSTIPFEITGRYFTCKGWEAFLGFGKDITTKLLEEEDRTRKESEINALVETMPCILRTTDKNLVITSTLGAGLLNILEKPGETIGQILSDYNKAHNYCLPKTKFKLALSGKQQFFESKHLPSHRIFLNSVKPLVNRTQIIGTISASLDITEIKNARNFIEEQNVTIRKLTAAYVKAQEEEREFTSLELHDRIIQPLTAIFHQLEMLDEKSDEERKRLIQKTIHDTLNTIADCRSLTRSLFPLSLKQVGLKQVIKEELMKLQEATKCNFLLEYEISKSLPVQLETTLYRISYESIWNIYKHANATSVQVSIKQGSAKVELMIKDNGKGFIFRDIQTTSEVKGISNMKRRAEIIGGSFAIRSELGQGTTVSVSLPLT
ncbi:MAG: PAS domain S-box protein [Dehalogenimonas sp.]